MFLTSWMSSSRSLCVCMMFSDASFSLILLLCGWIIELATAQCYCVQNILGIGLYHRLYAELKYILIFEYMLLHFFFHYIFVTFFLLFL